MMHYFKAMLCCMTLAATAAHAGDNGRTITAKVAEHPRTFCNPLNLNYRFMRINGGNGIREAADPVVIKYHDRYYLFASKSSGYWYTTDFSHWTHVFIADNVLPIEDYAPGLFIHNDYVYYAGSVGRTATLYRSNAPEKGIWEPVKQIDSHWDPAFHVEGDKLYLYYGSSSRTPIYMRTFDLNTLEPLTDAQPAIDSHTDRYGWERPGEQNELTRRPYIEGAWMTKHAGKFYLQYAGPGTEWKSYADGVYVGDTPVGPFRYMENSPVSHKPAGFMGGAGHGCLFTTGPNYWKAATNAISVRHAFERRLSFFPVGFDADGYLYTDTYLGDYPLYLPTEKKGPKQHRPDWMLLSCGKAVKVSSALPGYPARNLVDEEARTAWVAQSNGSNEWVEIDLGGECAIHAIQVNYDEYGATQLGFNDGLYESYRLYASHDGATWSLIADKGDKRTDTPHDYTEFEKPFKARYIKWANVAYNPSDNVSLREIRVFGKGSAPHPARVEQFTLERNAADRCRIHIEWPAAAHADGYNVCYGIAPDKLYNQMQVTGNTRTDINCLNSDIPYYFRIDAYNESGIARGKKLLKAE